MKELKSKELPPLNEALYLNCELLFSLSERINLSEKDKNDLDKMLHNNMQPVVLNKYLDEKYSFENQNDWIDLLEDPKFDGKKIMIASSSVSENTAISLCVNDKEISDWKINKVSRKDKENYKSFIAEFTSEQIKDYKFNKGDKIKITFMINGDSENQLEYSFNVNAKKILFFIDSYEFEIVK